jgi:hypothetical protein
MTIRRFKPPDDNPAGARTREVGRRRLEFKPMPAGLEQFPGITQSCAVPNLPPGDWRHAWAGQAHTGCIIPCRQPPDLAIRREQLKSHQHFCVILAQRQGRDGEKISGYNDGQPQK